MKFKRFSNPFHPGEIFLEEFLEPKGISQRAFAKQQRTWDLNQAYRP
jgi:plasmid maintenance system antidote protein VapI